ncbi:MAG: aldo/keto reductase [Pseudomonadota bacterium]
MAETTGSGNAGQPAASEHSNHAAEPQQPDRRQLLQRGVVGSAGLLLTGGAGAEGSGPATAPTAPAADQGAPQVRSYRRLGRTGLKIADISFGSSRLRTGDEHLVHHALDRGVNYFDTAESYGRGVSETVLGRALKGRRDEVILATKMHCGPTTSQATMMRELEGSLRRLQTDRVEIYFNHAVNSIDRLENDEWYEFLSRAKQQGKLRFNGISGHAGRLIPVIEHAVDNDLIDVVLAAYNFGQDPAFYEGLTRSFDFVATQPDLPRVLQKARAKDVGVIAMKTLMGARLNDLRHYEQAGNTFAQAAFRWTLSSPLVSALVVSMTGTDVIDEYLGASGAETLAAHDLDLLQSYAARNGLSYCKHACDQCESSCPYGVQIADVLRTRMYATDYRDLPFARTEYAALATNAEACLGCDGSPCRDACPHGIDTATLCAPTHRLLA